MNNKVYRARKSKRAMFGMAVVYAAIANPVSAGITLGDSGMVKLFADTRFRIETDSRIDSAGVAQSRQRLRIRARTGMSFKPNDRWSGSLRLSTASDSLNSPHITLGTNDLGKNTNFGIDRAHIDYANDALNVTMGKSALRFWQQNEVWWDTDISPEGIGATYKTGHWALNGHYVVIANDSAWGGSHQIATLYQAVYRRNAKDRKYIAAIGGANISDPLIGTGYNANSHTIISMQMKKGSWLAGADYISSNASSENTAYVVQGRYKLNNKFGLRAYYYNVGAFSVLGDGTFSQDNFPNPGSTGVSNFSGYRLQLDYKAGKNTSIDVRYYSMNRIKDTATLPATGSDALINDQSRNRIQVNINVKL